MQACRKDTVDPTLIETVDVVWGGGSLSDAFLIETHGTWRALIASHVIEHLPDPITFLDAAARLLDPVDGVVVLAVPDKRWCFDLLKPVSTTGQLLEAHRRRLTVHSADKLFDHNAYSASAGGRTGWGRESLSEISLYVSLEHAKAMYDQWDGSVDATYIDCHAWQFTPASFALTILELSALGVVDWHLEWLAPEPATEFLVHLRRGAMAFASPAEREAKRQELLIGIIHDLREQAEFVVDAQVEKMQPVEAVEDASLTRRLEHLERRVAEIAEGVRPAVTLFSALLPLRRAVARLRGRV